MSLKILLWVILGYNVVQMVARLGLLMFNEYPRPRPSLSPADDVIGAVTCAVLVVWAATLL